MAQRKRVTVVTIVTILVFSMVYAVAASLNVTTGTLGAGTAAVSSCDSDGVAVAYTTSFSSALGAYRVTTVSVSGISTPACDGKSMKVTLLDASDVSLGEQTVTIATPAASPTNLDFSAQNVLASAVLKVAVVISG